MTYAEDTTDAKVEDFVKAVADLKFPDTFNPYSDECDTHDHPGAADVRRKGLSAVLYSAIETICGAVDTHSPIDLWVGEAPGWRGARRTGLAFTDDYSLREHLGRWNIWLNPDDYPTKTRISENSSNSVWNILRRIPDEQVFLWNIFPLHPHYKGDRFSNRRPNHEELKAGSDILLSLIRMLHPRRIIGIGHRAENGINNAISQDKWVLHDYMVERPGSIGHARHPSFVNQRPIFYKQMCETYGLNFDVVREAAGIEYTKQYKLWLDRCV